MAFARAAFSAPPPATLAADLHDAAALTSPDGRDAILEALGDLEDPNAVQPILTTGAKVEIPGHTVGHVVCPRVAVLRHRSGLSAWSDAVQVTVR